MGASDPARVVQPAPAAQPDKAFRDALIEQLPSLRAFARSLSGNGDLADDLVQDTMVRAWTNFGSFRPGSNMKAWLFTILRNLFVSDRRRSGREISDPEDGTFERLGLPASQEMSVQVRDFRRAFSRLPDEQREALVLVGASGFSYEEAAEIAQCALGTMKSRVSRARKELAEQLGGIVEPAGANSPATYATGSSVI